MNERLTNPRSLRPLEEGEDGVQCSWLIFYTMSWVLMHWLNSTMSWVLMHWLSSAISWVLMQWLSSTRSCVLMQWLSSTMSWVLMQWHSYTPGRDRVKDHYSVLPSALEQSR